MCSMRWNDSYCRGVASCRELAARPGTYGGGCSRGRGTVKQPTYSCIPTTGGNLTSGLKVSTWWGSCGYELGRMGWWQMWRSTAGRGGRCAKGRGV